MATMTKVFTGKDKYDLDKQLWDWRSLHPRARIETTHPDVRLPLEMQGRRPGGILIATDALSRQIDYREAT
jgi:hypothetical protein